MRRSGLKGLTLGLFVFAAGLVGSASAHAHLAASEPADRAVVAEVPAQLELTFSEAVETGISRFYVYRLDTELPDLEEGPAERDWQRINAQAGMLVNEVLGGAENEDLQVDADLANVPSRSEQVSLVLEEDLGPGIYFAFWRVLSIDTHITEGFVTFIVANGR